jgi:hypothetical protein
MPKQSKTIQIPSAETMSLKTGRAIGQFGSNPRVTDLESKVIVKSQDEIDNNLLSGKTPKGAPKRSQPKAKGPKGKTEKKTRVSDPIVEEKIGQIGGILSTLDQEVRFAVLKKLCGVFGFKPKGTKESVGTKAKESKKKGETKMAPKNEFNSTFSETLEGKLLDVTSKVMKKAARSKTEKPGPEYYEVHSYLVTRRAVVKLNHKGEKLSPYEFSEDCPPDVAVHRLAKSYRAIKSSYERENIPTPARDAIVAAGLCLFQGTWPKEMSLEGGKIPPENTWKEVSSLVPRTDDETEERTSAILARIERVKQRKKEAPDNQVAPAKRPRLCIAPPKEDTTEGEGTNAASMEMETQGPAEGA